jgi:DNA-binding response OmpR family regulator
MKILVVEDEQRIARYIKKGLELKSHVVDLAHDGQSGLDMAIDGAYDIIILDRMLPQLEGAKVCSMLRAEKISTPILMLTAKNQLDDRVEGLNAGADDYLGKPFAFVELLARVNALGRRPQKTNNPTLSVGNLTLNPIGFEVTRAGKSISLSKKEFSLLEFLLRHPGQVFSPEQLTEQVWNYDSDVLPNTAQVYMGYLRQKIDKSFHKEKPLIHTIRGFGYKLQ